MQETSHDEDEAISLCDLTLYSDQSAQWDSFDLSNGSCSSSSYFEFNQEFNHPITTSIDFPREDIIFCGKLIPYKQQDTYEHDSSSVIRSKTRTREDKMLDLSLHRGPFRWKFSYSTKNGSRNTTLMDKKEMYNTNEIANGHKMPILTSLSSGKGKWYLFMFGISRFSMEVNLADIKSSRNRRQCSSPLHTPPAAAAAMFGSRNWDEEVRGGRNRGWWFWGLIRALSCGGAPPEGID